VAIALVLAACSGAAPDSPATAAPEETVEKESGGKAETVDPKLVTTLADVKSAVVQIEAQGTFADPEFGEYSGAGLGSGFIIDSSGLGSGFIIDSSGLAITNNHVVTGAALLNVWVGGDTTK